ncbi:phosphoribulokinase/uridine kinase [Colletotrichum graminicola]|uniref:Phosphoribulokinase/uridine kinase n=1 Tax=Colletotrichum graminicola (strain M1.001 / M2 / FGSC 10212) TaxID=645133 RepID=E3QZ89_COLGM|nr:phosphoribulokinase/uridine kinase [Colletotrichum graminicola M1.001]EFQ36177.1 phosphoribulokinase/uridine kinase [Colletotrichum graminicola M1.001]WDK22207.1 phosphoribulokinase/uridine kinase [Colletotrichum graminicola]
MESTYKALVQHTLLEWNEKRRSASDTAVVHPRLIIAIAGPPGSGKTTIARRVVSDLNSSPEPRPKSVVVSADGFHLPLEVLRALPDATEAIARRGAPWTFNGPGLVRLVRQLRASAGLRPVQAPTFDHRLKDPVPRGLTIEADVDVCLVEGNYLLVDEEPWSQVVQLVDDRWLVRVEPTLARNRVAARHVAAGVEDTMEKALFRAESNDMVNGEYIVRRSEGRYDLLIDSVEELPN